MTLSRILVVAALLLAGCRVAPPSASVTSSLGVVRADTEDRARLLAASSSRLQAELRTLLPGLRDVSLEIWLQPDIQVYRGAPYPEHIAGLTDYENGRIYLRESDAQTELHLAHELVHALLDDTWSALPGIVEEGLCDVVAVFVTGSDGTELHAKRLLEAVAFFGGVEVVLESGLPLAGGEAVSRLKLAFDGAGERSAAAMLELGDEELFRLAATDEGVGLYGLGYVVALAIIDRIGLNGLHALCMRVSGQGAEQVGARRILRAAGLPVDDAAFERLVRSHLSASELPALARLLSRRLAEAAVAAVRSLPAAPADPEQFLDDCRPVFGLAGSPARFDLYLLPEFRAAVLAEWSAAGR